MIELPKYQWPPLKDVAIGILTRAQIFMKRAGTIILGTTIILWALASIPQAAPGQKQSEVSVAGHIANGIKTVVRPIGFNHDIALALLPPIAAREVAVSAMPPSIRSTRATMPQRAASGRQPPPPLVPRDRARLPRLVRVRAAMHLDYRGHEARDEWLEVAVVHGRISFRTRLHRGGRDLLDGGGARFIATP